MPNPSDMTVIADGSGVGIVMGPSGEFAPSFVYTMPISEPMGITRSTVLTVVVPGLDAPGLRRFAAIAIAIAEAQELHLDHQQASEFLKPIIEAPVEGLAPDAGHYTVDGESGDDTIDKIHEAHDGHLAKPLAHTLCTVCGVRIYGALIERGACLACAPALPKGERPLGDEALKARLAESLDVEFHDDGTASERPDTVATLGAGQRWCPDCNGEGVVWTMDATPNLTEHEHACTYPGCAEGNGIVANPTVPELMTALEDSLAAARPDPIAEALPPDIGTDQDVVDP